MADKIKYIKNIYEMHDKKMKLDSLNRYYYNDPKYIDKEINKNSNKIIRTSNSKDVTDRFDLIRKVNTDKTYPYYNAHATKVSHAYNLGEKAGEILKNEIFKDPKNIVKFDK
jgi:hypothetical protein